MIIFTVLSFFISCFSFLFAASSSDDLNMNQIDKLILKLKLEASREDLNETDLTARFYAQPEAHEKSTFEELILKLKLETSREEPNEIDLTTQLYALPGAHEKSTCEDGYYSLVSESSDAENDDENEVEFQIPGRWSNRSLKLVFPEIFQKTYLSAAVFLFYGLDKYDRHYLIAMKYLGICDQIIYTDFDPNSLSSFNGRKIFNDWGLDTSRPSFARFCYYVRYYDMPKSSPIYWAKIALSKRMKWQFQSEAILNFAFREIVEIFTNIDVKHFQKQVKIDPAILDIVLEFVKERVFNYLSYYDARNGNFTVRLLSLMRTVVANTCIIENGEESSARKNIFEYLSATIWPVLDVIYNYDYPSEASQDPDLSFPYFI